MSENPPIQNSKIDAHPRADFGEAINPPYSGDPSNTEANRKKLHALLSGLWDQSRQTVAERVEILQQAKTLAIDGRLDEPARLRAVDSAHKLAGVLGTFGLPRGTELAREAEEAFGKQAAMRPVELVRIAALLEELEKLVRTAGPYPGP